MAKSWLLAEFIIYQNWRTAKRLGYVNSDLTDVGWGPKVLLCRNRVLKYLSHRSQGA